MTHNIKLAILPKLINRGEVMKNQGLFKTSETAKIEPWPRGAGSASWLVKPFIKSGLSLLCGAQQAGKSSLAVSIAKAEAERKPYWQGGPSGQGRKSIFLTQGVLRPQHLCLKIGQPNRDILLVAGFKVKYPNFSFENRHLSRPTPARVLKLVKKIKPAFVFFDYEELDGANKI